MTSPSTAGHMPGPENLNPPVASNHYKKVVLSTFFNNTRFNCFLWSKWAKVTMFRLNSRMTRLSSRLALGKVRYHKLSSICSITYVYAYLLHTYKFSSLSLHLSKHIKWRKFSRRHMQIENLKLLKCQPREMKYLIVHCTRLVTRASSPKSLRML